MEGRLVRAHLGAAVGAAPRRIRAEPNGVNTRRSRLAKVADRLGIVGVGTGNMAG
jgi:hypothetical protein